MHKLTHLDNQELKSTWHILMSGFNRIHLVKLHFFYVTAMLILQLFLANNMSSNFMTLSRRSFIILSNHARPKPEIYFSTTCWTEDKHIDKILRRYALFINKINQRKQLNSKEKRFSVWFWFYNRLRNKLI